MLKETEEVARLMKEARESGDREKSMALFADDAVYTAGGPARGSRYEGKEAIRAATDRAMNQVFLVDKMEFKEPIIAEGYILQPISVKGKSRITGRDYANELLLLYTIKDGKIVHQHEYLDTMASARATGDLPYPD